ncbi:hypothetical protein F8388_001232, partial [Cannabis sativa]
GQGEAQQRQQVGEISGPGKRWGHTCNAIKEGRFLYVFGGYGKDNSTQKWSEPVIKGTHPTPRDSHSCTTVGDNLYVFGGTDGMNPLRDLHILDTSSHTWISPCFRGEGPEAREGHNAALVGKRLFIFGGCGKSFSTNDEVYYNDLYILNTETFVWKRATTSGTPPSPRDSHTCSSWKNNVIVIGGEDGHDYYLSDVHILDTDTLVWRELNTTGQLLTPRAGHCTVALGKKLFVFGGFTDAQNLYNDLYMLDIEQLTPIQDNTLARLEGGVNRYQPSTVPIYGQAAIQNFSLMQQSKKTFQAKVTERISDGYTIETIIDGKPLRGILFSNRPDYHHKPIPTPSRKRVAAETGGAMSNGDYSSKTSSGVLKQDAAENKQVVNVNEESTSHVPCSEGAIIPTVKDQTPCDTSQPPQVTSDPGNEQLKDAPETNSKTPRETRTSSPPVGSGEVLKDIAPAPETDPMALDPDDKTLTSGEIEATTSMQN